MTTPTEDPVARKAVRRVQLFGRAVGSMDGPELVRWLRKYTDAHPNPSGNHAREALRWLVEVERSGDRKPR